MERFPWQHEIVYDGASFHHRREESTSSADMFGPLLVSLTKEMTKESDEKKLAAPVLTFGFRIVLLPNDSTIDILALRENHIIWKRMKNTPSENIKKKLRQFWINDTDKWLIYATEINYNVTFGVSVNWYIRINHKSRFTYIYYKNSRHVKIWVISLQRHVCFYKTFEKVIWIGEKYYSFSLNLSENTKSSRIELILQLSCIYFIYIFFY